MTHSEIMRIYRDVSMEPFGRFSHWEPEGLNSVRVFSVAKKELLFTYNEDGTWILEGKNKLNGGNENEMDCDYCSVDSCILEEYESHDEGSLVIRFVAGLRLIRVKVVDCTGYERCFATDKRLIFCPMCGKKLIINGGNENEI